MVTRQDPSPTTTTPSQSHHPPHPSHIHPTHTYLVRQRTAAPEAQRLQRGAVPRHDRAQRVVRQFLQAAEVEFPHALEPPQGGERVGGELVGGWVGGGAVYEDDVRVGGWVWPWGWVGGVGGVRDGTSTCTPHDGHQTPAQALTSAQ